jgi:16S rRNA C967 or C1407 C5-methylase (RsmB/RsmF family)/NOL1/NOP2/fmu family ribosome biogenesis protein
MYLKLQSILPKQLLASIKDCTGFDEEAFIRVHQSGEQVTAVRYNPLKWPKGFDQEGLPGEQRIPWTSHGFYLSQRPSFTMDPGFHGGAYYVHDASGMFLEQALTQTVDLSKPIRILDLCAAPGGKSTLIQSLISKDSLLVSNEVIKSRVHVLRENMVKWGGANVLITNNDPAAFSRLDNYFDVILVDAPCSGSGLFRKDPASIREWSVEGVKLCGLRQERILATIWPALKKDGILIYSTCSYSTQENEDILDWVMTAFGSDSIKLRLDPDWKIIVSASTRHGAQGYRFYPDKIKGEGFFMGCLRKKEGGIFSFPKNKKKGFDKLSRKEEARLNGWLDPLAPLVFFQQDEHIHALPQGLFQDLLYVQSSTYLKKAGIRLGKMTGPELIPDHELALSLILNQNIPSVSLSKEQAIQYLRKEELQLDLNQKGWALANYQDWHLGWLKILEKRINNYYPKEWRILKSE